MELTIQTRLPRARPAPPPAFWKTAQTAALRLLADAGKPNAEISIVLCDDAHIHALNKQWRNKNAPTDVLSWPLPDEGEVLGDVVISLDTAEKQARARNWDVEDEIALLLVHGILHLLGHEDETLAGSKKMKAVETRILGKPLDKVETGIVRTAGTITP